MIWKVVGAVLIVFASTFYSLEITAKKRRRIVQLNLLSALADDFYDEIKYRSKESERLIEECLSKKTYAPLCNLNFSQLDIEKDEAETAEGFFNRLGTNGRSAQLGYCREFSDKMKKLAKAAEKTFPSSAKAINAAGFFGGVFLAIIVL